MNLFNGVQAFTALLMEIILMMRTYRNINKIYKTAFVEKQTTTEMLSKGDKFFLIFENLYLLH